MLWIAAAFVVGMVAGGFAVYFRLKDRYDSMVCMIAATHADDHEYSRCFRWAKGRRLSVSDIEDLNVLCNELVDLRDKAKS